MITIREGDKREVAVIVTQARGSGAWLLTSPQYRILSSARAVLVDWTAATWDSVASELYALFDSTATGLTEPGVYFVQLRGVIGAERYQCEIPVTVKECGP